MEQLDDPVLAVLQRAEAFADMGRAADVYDVVTRGLGENPGEPLLLTYATWSCLRMSRVDEAVSLAEEALAAGPDIGWVHLIASRAFLAAGEGRRALVAVERGLDLEPDDAIMHTQHAFVRTAGGRGVVNKRLARRELARALELAPDDPECLLLVAQGSRALKDVKHARELVGRALALAPENSDLLVEQVLLTDEAGEATHQLAGVLAADPEHRAASYLLHARIWIVLGVPVLTAAVLTTLVLFAGGWLWRGPQVSGGAGGGFIGVLVALGWGARKAKGSVPQAVLDRTLRDGGWWTRLGRLLSWGSFASTFAVAVGLVAIRSQGGAGTLIGLASVSLALSGAAMAFLVLAAERAARVQGLYPPDAEGTETVRVEWQQLRRVLVVLVPVVTAVGLVTAALSGWAGRTDALWAAAWGTSVSLVPLVAKMWLCAAELRHRGAWTRALGWVAPAVISVLLVVCGLAGLMNGPFA